MSILKRFLGSKEEPIETYKDFWNWFSKHEKAFFKIVKEHENVTENFLDPLHDKLKELQDGFFYLTGMFDENTAELIVTADTAIKNIVFVEALMADAPTLPRWKFTALKQPSNIENSMVEMDDFKFDSSNIFFFSNDYPDYPDEIDITIVHQQWTEGNKEIIEEGVHIFLEIFLGEINFATTVDNLQVIGKSDADNDLIPIEKLKDYLIWREKEFIEKYDGVRHETEKDSYVNLEASLENGDLILALVDKDLLEWDSKASHPWILTVEIKYTNKRPNGMPDDVTYPQLNHLEEEMMNELKDYEGYLNIGRETWNGTRIIFFACKEFRKPSLVMFDIQKKYKDQFEISYDIYKDKYWQSFKRFNSSNDKEEMEEEE